MLGTDPEPRFLRCRHEPRLPDCKLRISRRLVSMDSAISGARSGPRNERVGSLPPTVAKSAVYATASLSPFAPAKGLSASRSMAKSAAGAIPSLSPFAPAKGFPATVAKSAAYAVAPGNAVGDRPGARPADGNSASNGVMRPSKSAIPEAAIIVENFGPAHGSQPGAQAGRHALEGREDLGSVGIAHQNGPRPSETVGMPTCND